jgi:hypothetical protein
MSDTETTTGPTAWFVHVDNNGEYTAVARWYWPNGVNAEVYHPDTDTWELARTNLFERLSQEPDWLQVSQGDAEGLIARSGGAAPDTTV